MRTRMLLTGTLLLLSAAPVAAQEMRRRTDREELRHRIEERFTQRAKERFGLNEEQVKQLGETSREFGGRRREIEERARTIREALGNQLRPGVAANRDSVTKLTEAALELRIAYAETFRDEHRATAKFLDPVQRAQLFAMRDRLLHHAREISGKRHWDRHGRGGRGRGGDSVP
jgi:hypothetical protein